MTQERLFAVPHTHYDAVVFKTRAEYLEMGLPIILEALQCLQANPSYRFVLDQVCYIRPFLERYPEEEGTFRSLLAQGRLQITCGMDTMADVNIPSGESFVRQVLYGKGYCRDRLGVEVTAGWALDTFGHHPQMPQLLRKAGFDCYYFARGVPKAMNYEFIWQGIDGSQILALWLPYSYGFLYGSPQNLAEFSEFVRARYAQIKPLASTSVLLGLSGVDLGVPEPHLATLAAEFNRQSSAPFEIVVASPDEYLAALRAELAAGPELAVIGNDLNPIFQGCYSSRIEVKQTNRELERLLTTVEKLDALAAWLGLPIDGASLMRAWEPVLFNQFHDCICGVQVDKVFDDTMKSYAFSKRLGTELLEERLQSITDRVDTRGEGIALLVYNTLSWERTDVVEVEVAFTQTGVLELGLQDAAGQPLPVQGVEAERHAAGGLKRARVIFVARGVPALGYAVYHLIPNGAATLSSSIAAGSSEHSAFSVADSQQMSKDHGFIANEYLRAEFDLWTGALVSLRTKPQDWEALRGGAGNVIARERDGGDFWQLKGALKGGMATAGDQRQPPPQPGQAELSCDQVGDGAVHRGSVMADFRISHPFGSGWVVLRAQVYAGIRRMDLRTEILNNDEWVRYRALFPTTIVGGKIVHEIPFGAIERPNQELPAQNWIDYSDGRHGLALLNRGLPGNNVDEGVMMLSLCRAAQLVAYAFAGGYEPGVSSASGQEKGKRLIFDYALLPHEGSWQEAQAYRAGLEFNNPLLVCKSAPHAGSLPSRWELLSVKPGNVVVSATKASADGQTIVRVYEAEGRPVLGAEIRLAPGLQDAEETDLLEQAQHQLTPEQGVLRFDLGAFEIKTFKLRLAPCGATGVAGSA
jgi:alpha-mannosidase